MNNTKPSIAIYLQHYLAPSMTFIYRQLQSARNYFEPVVLCSHKLENINRFPFDNIFFKRRNFLTVKETVLFTKLYGHHKLLSINPKLSHAQQTYFKTILRDKNVSLIHAHFGPSALEILHTAKVLNIPLVVTFHGYDASFLLSKKRYLENIKELFFYSNIITVSEKMREELIEIGSLPDRTKVIKCGIPVEYFNFIKRKPLSEKMKSGEEIKFLQVSNFVEKKGHFYTLTAFAEFLKTYENAKLILAGDGYLKPKMENYSVELGLTDKVEFKGLVNEMEVKVLMKDADLFLHHSVTSSGGDKEGIPTVIMEAMASGLPVISTYHAGIPELIDNGVNGFLVKEKDVNSYVDLLINLKNLPADVSSKAREKVESKFSLEVETEKLFKLYSSLIKKDINP